MISIVARRLVCQEPCAAGVSALGGLGVIPALERLAEKLDQSPATDAEARVFRRLYFAQTETVDLDGNGRILIPERLLEFAGLKHEVVLIGVRDHLELWDAERWQQYMAQNAPRFDAVAEGAFQK